MDRTLLQNHHGSRFRHPKCWWVNNPSCHKPWTILVLNLNCLFVIQTARQDEPGARQTPSSRTKKDNRGVGVQQRQHRRGRGANAGRVSNANAQHWTVIVHTIPFSIRKHVLLQYFGFFLSFSRYFRAVTRRPRPDRIRLGKPSKAFAIRKKCSKRICAIQALS